MCTASATSRASCKITVGFAISGSLSNWFKDTRPSVPVADISTDSSHNNESVMIFFSIVRFASQLNSTVHVKKVYLYFFVKRNNVQHLISMCETEDKNWWTKITASGDDQYLSDAFRCAVGRHVTIYS